VRLPEASAEHDLYEAAALWWNRPRDIPALVDAACDELDLVWPPTADDLPAFRYGREVSLSTLRLSIDQVSTEWFVAEPMVTIYADDENWTARAGRSGMHPDDIFRPVNQLAAGEPSVVLISQSNECGVLGCGGISIRVARDGDRVVWEWLDNGAITKRHAFDAATYDAEVARAAADRSWVAAVN
jgi:hypothetical protein